MATYLTLKVIQSCNTNQSIKRVSPSFTPIRKYNLSNFLERAYMVHGLKYDYNRVTDNHINGKDSLIPIICRKCSYEWLSSIHNHISGKGGCPNCAGKIPWTYSKFLDKVKLVHGNNYNYTKISDLDIRGAYSHIVIICNTCNHEWKSSIHHHINGKGGCPNCARKIPWTYEKFIRTALGIHGNRYDYSLVTPDHIKGNKSKIPIICLICKYKWKVSIVAHIYSNCGCPKCAGNCPWNPDRYYEFIEKSALLHKNRYNYYLIKPEQIRGNNSKIIINCKSCGNDWESTIFNHIVSRRGCPECSGKAPWTKK